jgi:hypothetical protein
VDPRKAGVLRPATKRLSKSSDDVNQSTSSVVDTRPALNGSFSELSSADRADQEIQRRNSKYSHHRGPGHPLKKVAARAPREGRSRKDNFRTFFFSHRL